MTINTLDILTSATVLARGHARNETESKHLFAGRFICVKMSTLCFIRAFVSEEVDVTHLDLFDTVDLDLVVVFARRINTLTRAITRDNFLADCRFVNRRVRDWRRRGCCLGGPAIRCDGCRL